MPVTIDNRHPRLRVGQQWLAAHLRAVLRAEGRPRAWVDVSLVQDEEIRELNREHRAVDEVTDVLGFALEEDDGFAAGLALPGQMELLGDVVISLDTARRQAEAFARRPGQSGATRQNWRLREETAFLATHGLLHLLGWDHGTPDEAQAMQARERELFAALSSVDAHAFDRSDHAVDPG